MKICISISSVMAALPAFERQVCYMIQKSGGWLKVSRVLIVTYTALTMVLIYHPLYDRHYSLCSTKNKCSLEADVEAETPILWPPYAKNWLIWKDPDAGKDRRQEEKGTTDDEMVGWHHQLNGHGFGWTPGVGDGQGGLACCSPWGHKELDMTEWLNWLTDDLLGQAQTSPTGAVLVMRNPDILESSCPFLPTWGELSTGHSGSEHWQIHTQWH